MRGDSSTIKERLNIVDVVTPYLKLEKTGANFKGRCPFHNEKTASFFISLGRQSYYCFGCGAKGDIFTFVEEMEGTDFRGALKILAEKAGVELEEYKGESKTLKDNLYEALDLATKYFQEELANTPEALTYLKNRGINEESVVKWKIGFAKDDWRALYAYLLSKGITKDIQLKAGLIKQGEDLGKEPYDVFRGRIIFPLSDSQGKVIAFSGRSLAKDLEPKYLNSPDTPLFTKSEVLYGLDLAKEEIRKKNYAVLVEGQMDLVLSHQGGVMNAVASSGTAFTHYHLERLRKLSPRVILAFDGDEAGEKAAVKSAVLGLTLNMEVKIAQMSEGKDPADLVRESTESWKNVLRDSTHAIEYVLSRLIEREKDKRKLGKAIQEKVLSMVTLLMSSMEKAHFVSIIARKTGMKEEIIWEDLRKAVAPSLNIVAPVTKEDLKAEEPKIGIKERIATRLLEVDLWLKDLTPESAEFKDLTLEKSELEGNLAYESLRETLLYLIKEQHQAQGLNKEEEVMRLLREIQDVNMTMATLEERRKVR